MKHLQEHDPSWCGVVHISSLNCSFCRTRQVESNFIYKAALRQMSQTASQEIRQQKKSKQSQHEMQTSNDE